MKTTMDKRGRVVIPTPVRERIGLMPGAQLEIIEDQLGIRMERVAAGPKLTKIGKRLVVRPTVAIENRPAIDVIALVEEERRRLPSALGCGMRFETPAEFLSRLKKGTS